MSFFLFIIILLGALAGLGSRRRQWREYDRDYEPSDYDGSHSDCCDCSDSGDDR